MNFHFVFGGFSPVDANPQPFVHELQEPPHLLTEFLALRLLFALKTMIRAVMAITKVIMNMSTG